MEKSRIITIIHIIVLFLLVMYIIVYKDAKNYINLHYQRIRSVNVDDNNSLMDFYRLNDTVSENITSTADDNNTKESTWKDVLSCQRIRQERFKKKCKQLNLPLKSLKEHADSDFKGTRINGIIVDKVHKVLANTIAKTGCSSWKYILIKNSPNGDIVDKRKKGAKVHGKRTLAIFGLTKLSSYSPEEVTKYFLDYFSFITIRHPLVRLESAYTSKLLRKNKVFHRRYGKSILNRYRNKEKEPNKRIFETGDGVRFDEFLRYVIESSRGRRNGHWAPYTSETSCGMKGVYIAKLETASLDMNYIIKTRLSNKTAHIHLNPNKATVEHILDKKYMQLPYFSNLTNPMYYINKLMNFYGNDMLLYGYKYEYDEKTKQVLAKCEYYDSNGYCC